LLDSPVPVTLQHHDLHGGNVFQTGQVFDWGDSVIGHPFGVLLFSP
ncbi:MAG: phosphotransferase, partial [Dactylosporangium sp.]|nr:phosphotransferase [Dactylosporangium sp.]